MLSAHRIITENNIVLTHFGFFLGQIVVSGFLSKHRPATIADGQIDRSRPGRGSGGGDGGDCGGGGGGVLGNLQRLLLGRVWTAQIRKKKPK